MSKRSRKSDLLVEKGIGDRLRNFRKKLNLTREELAKTLETTSKQIERYEKNETEAGILFLDKLVEKFKLSPTWLLTGEGPMFLEEGEGRGKVIDLEDKRLKQMFEYLRERWESADLEGRRIIELEFSRAFHDYVDWLKKRAEAEEKAE